MSSLLITVDALRTSHLAQYGYERDTMPALDELLDEGATRFASAFANGTNTGISLPSLLTSRYRGDERLTDGPTVASALPDRVSSAAVHSNTYFASKTDTVEGFDTYEDFGVGDPSDDGTTSAFHRTFRRSMDLVRPLVDRFGLRTAAERLQERLFPAGLIHEITVYDDAAAVTDRALEWLDTVDGEFFLWVHYMDPHRPYGIDLDDPRFGESTDDHEIRDLMATAGIHPERITPDRRRRMIDLYDSDIYYTSRHLTRLFDGLRERNLWDDLDVILTADHGEEFGEHGQYFHRNRPYDELVHVPLVVRSDRADGGTVDEQRELLDVAPTICGFHGAEPPADFRGRDLFDPGDRRVIATGSFRDDGPVVGTRWDDTKYIAVAERGATGLTRESADVTEELYDLDADPRERENLAAERRDACRTFRERIPEGIFAKGGGVPEDASGDVRDRLEGLGYLE